MPGAAQPPALDLETPASEFPPTVRIERNDKTITAVKYGPDDKGFAIICTPPENDPEGLTRSVFYDLPPYSVHVTVDKNVIRAPIAFVRQRGEGGDGELEAYAGKAVEPAEGSDECLPALEPAETAGAVVVTQGKTRLTGSKLEYSETSGLAVVKGPIVFERPQEDDTLKGTSERITINVDEEKTLLEGDVTLNSRCRVSKAERVEYDDTKNLAVLFGSPATSVQTDGKGEVRGERLEYNLETNDVVVTFGAVKGGEGSPLAKFDDSPSDACK